MVAAAAHFAFIFLAVTYICSSRVVYASFFLSSFSALAALSLSRPAAAERHFGNVVIALSISSRHGGPLLHAYTVHAQDVQPRKGNYGPWGDSNSDY